jgi:hypothetical protein
MERRGEMQDSYWMENRFFRSARIFVLSALIPVALHSEEEIDFNRDIRPLLSNRCNACHGPDEEERKADLRLDTREGALMDLGGYAALVPGDPEASELFYRITTEDEDDLMPPPEKGPRFTEAEVDLIRRWIKQGGEYAMHWSYQPLKRPELPKAGDSGHPVDRFIRARLEKEGLEPAPRADRLTLARRLSLDLTGLPPTWEEAAGFRDDSSADAVEKYVDQLLAKPSFGERWARVWLDLARYADSAGYAGDPPRTIWAFRDYVIRSFNENKPFDQFTIEQIAGDLLPDPDEEQLIATAFHRNTLTNNEGGTNDEEFRNVAVVDRVNTTMAVWMGTTMACAQCHTHKYDPLTHLEYFQLFDFFNQSADMDRKDEAPFHEVWTDEQKARKKELETGISSLKETLQTVTPEIEKAQQVWEQKWQQPFTWRSESPQSVSAKSAQLEVSGNGWIEAETKEATDRYELSFDVSQFKAPVSTGLRVDVPAEQTSNFVLSSVSAVYEPPNASEGRKGKFVRVDLPGKSRILHLAEIEVFSAGKNMAGKADVKMSSLYNNAVGARAIDGNTDGDYKALSVFHTSTEDNPWVELEFPQEVSIDEIKLWNRTDGGDSILSRVQGYRVSILDANRKEVFTETPDAIPSPAHSVEVSGRRQIKFSLAGASHEQAGFPAASVIEAADKKSKPKGWAIGGGTGKPQELILVFAEPFSEEKGTLSLVLSQESEYENHLLRKFRVSLTSENRLSQWVRIPGKVRNSLSKNDRSGAERKAVRDFFLTIAPPLADARAQLASMETELKQLKPMTTVPVLAELPKDKSRETHIHLRGSYLSLGEKATAGVPAVFHPLREDLPRNRLALAHWLVDSKNPMTPRVVANRFWEQLFGIGIVETSEEFGSQGELPSHPELLEWLAVELRDGGWNVKEFLKLLVTSETYLQSSHVDPEVIAKDPYNRLLERGPRFRISAEMVRDQALAVSGLLSEKMFGPPVNPPQPELGLKAAFGSGTDWVTSKGEDRYRRGIYTRWRRSSPYPSMATFDAPNREVCTVRRGRTNTPLQALVTMNDPVYVEAAQSWGRKAIERDGTLEEQIAAAFRETLIREPKPEEVQRLVELYREIYPLYQEKPDEAGKMAEDPIGAAPKDADVAALASWTVVGNVVLNLDELFLKR